MDHRFLTEESNLQPQTPVVSVTQEPEALERDECTSLEIRTKQQENALAQFVVKKKKVARRQIFTLPLLLLTSGLSFTLWRLNPSGIGAMVAAGLFGSSLLYTLIVLLTTQRGTQGAIEELVRMAGIRAIGPLIEMRLGFLNVSQIAATYDALIELLPQLRVHDAKLFSQEQRSFLYEVLEGVGQIGLSAEKQQRLRLAILEALNAVGDAQAIRIVRQLAKVPFWPKKPDVIQQAAQEILPLLEANLARAVSTQTLLRASAPEPAGVNILLRSASPATELDPAQLLRAAKTTSP